MCEHCCCEVCYVSLSLTDRETLEYESEFTEPHWAVQQKRDEEERNARVSLIAEEFEKRRGKKKLNVVC